LHYELGCYFRFRLTNVGFPEQKLSVQVTDVDGIHVDDVNVGKPQQSQILQNFATQPAGSDHKNLARLTYEIFGRGASFEGGIGHWPGTIEQLIDMVIVVIEFLVIGRRGRRRGG